MGPVRQDIKLSLARPLAFRAQAVSYGPSPLFFVSANAPGVNECV